MFDDVINQWDKNVYPEMLFHSFSCCICPTSLKTVILWKAHVQARTLATSFLEIREHSEEAFDGLFKIACTIANKNKITINKPRNVVRKSVA
jgi:hypothetical protein